MLQGPGAPKEPVGVRSVPRPRLCECSSGDQASGQFPQGSAGLGSQGLRSGSPEMLRNQGEDLPQSVP